MAVIELPGIKTEAAKLTPVVPAICITLPR